MEAINSIEKIIKKYILPLYFVGTFFTVYDMCVNRDEWKNFENSLRKTEKYVFTGQIIEDYHLALAYKLQIPILYKNLKLKADTNKNNILEVNEQINCLSRLGIEPQMYFEDQKRILPKPYELNFIQVKKAINSYNNE